MRQYKFMSLSKEYSGKNTYFNILPIEYEKDLTFGKGASKGPAEIIKASKHLEYYDEQFDIEPFEKGILTLPALKLKDKRPEQAMQIISEAILNHLDKKDKTQDRFLLSLGGDHSITIGIVKGLEQAYKDENTGSFDVVILDAHTDFFHSWNNSQFNHRCTAQRLISNHKILQVGVRSMDKDEADLIRDNDDINIIKAYDYNKDLLKQQLKHLKKNIYLSIDVDVFDISFIKNTGTPEPGGFFWNQMIGILQIIFQEKNIISADIVEFSPNDNFEAESFALAKLSYKLFALKMINNS